MNCNDYEEEIKQQNYLLRESRLKLKNITKEEESLKTDDGWKIFIKEEPPEMQNNQLLSDSSHDSIVVKEEPVEENFSLEASSIIPKTIYQNKIPRADSVGTLQNLVEGVPCTSSITGNQEDSSGNTAENKEFYECNSCTYKTFRKFDFKRHLLIHSNTKLFKCPECDYECNLKSLLQRHALSHSDREKLFKCSQCHYETNYKNHFKRHSLSHAETKLFKCPKCRYETNHSRDFKTHLLNHSNIKAFKCTDCDYATNRNKDLRTHMLRHSETKLFKCEKCGYETNYKQHFKNHLSSHEDIQIY